MAWCAPTVAARTTRAHHTGVVVKNCFECSEDILRHTVTFGSHRKPEMTNGS